EDEYPGAEIITFEPTRDDAKRFFSNVFSFQFLRMVCVHSYLLPRRDLLRRYDELQERLEPFGIRIRRDILEDEQRTISTSLYGEMLPLYVAKEKEEGRHYLNRISHGLEGVADFLQGARHIL